jgi:protein-tyrosine phosphatase
MRRCRHLGIGRQLLLACLSVLVAVGCGTQEQDSTQTSSAAVDARATGERHVPLSGQPNFRDIGGYETSDGRTMKWGELYRSGELGGLTDEDVSTLEDLELRTVVSFLLPEEVERHGADMVPEGARTVSQPISSERANQRIRQVQESIRSADFDEVPPELNAEFHRLLLDDGREQYAALLREIAQPESRPLAFHCSQGIHRAGTATAILLSALGVPWETVREDYLLSNEYRREVIDGQMEKARQRSAERQGIPPDEVDMISIEAFYVLSGSYIDAMMFIHPFSRRIAWHP